MGYGHYTAFAKNGNQWIKFDDTNVSKISTQEQLVTANAYTLFYVRKDIANKEIDFESIK